jgi:diguanylate cyclase (GGDEF)-like protein/PAS domain S-box-containing protein
MAETGTAPAERDAVFEAIIAHHPGAFIGAAADTGLFTEIPEELRATGLRPIEGPSSALGFALPEDQAVIIEAWHRLRAQGVSNCRFRTRAESTGPAGLHMVDLTHRLGVIAIVITGLDDEVSELAHEEIRPRLVTVRKDQAAVIIDADPQIHRVLGWSAEELAGRRSIDLVHPDDHQRAIAGWMDLLAVPQGEARRIRLRHLHRDGQVIWFEITNHNLLRGTDPCVLAEMLDITDEMAAEEALRASEQLLRRRATFDELTGCRNRAATLTALSETLDGADRGTAAVFVDLNDFKLVNDRFGHAAGDLVLAHVAHVLRFAVRDGDLVGRLGGDEFVVVCRDVPRLEQAQNLAAGLGAALEAAPLEVDGHVLRTRASIGVAWTRPGGLDADALIAHADKKMYEAKGLQPVPRLRPTVFP